MTCLNIIVFEKIQYVEFLYYYLLYNTLIHTCNGKSRMQISNTGDLQQNVDDDDHERIEEVEQEPHLHGLDGGRAGQRGGDREVDGGQHHHARDVDRVHQVVLGVS